MAKQDPLGRPLWTGRLKISLVEIAVKLYSVQSDAHRPTYTKTCPGCGEPLRQAFRCEACDELVSAEDAVRAYEYSDGQFQRAPESERVPKVAVAEISGVYHESRVPPGISAAKPYALVPQDAAAAESYSALVRALGSRVVRVDFAYRSEVRPAIITSRYGVLWVTPIAWREDVKSLALLQGACRPASTVAREDVESVRKILASLARDSFELPSDPNLAREEEELQRLRKGETWVATSARGKSRGRDSEGRGTPLREALNASLRKAQKRRKKA